MAVSGKPEREKHTLVTLLLYLLSIFFLLQMKMNALKSSIKCIHNSTRCLFAFTVKMNWQDNRLIFTLLFYSVNSWFKPLSHAAPRWHLSLRVLHQEPNLCSGVFTRFISITTNMTLLPSQVLT